MNSGRKRNWKYLVLRSVVCTGLFFIGISTVPHMIFSRQAGTWYRGDLETQTTLARGVEKRITEDLTRGNFSTGSKQFDGEWLFGTYLMAGMGFGQVALEHDSLRDRHTDLMALCIKDMLAEKVKAFDKEVWGNDPIESLDSDSDHAAYLGYLNLLMSFHRQLDPESEYAGLNDRISDALARRLTNSPALLLCSYPYEAYPVDNCFVIGSIALHARATGTDRDDLIEEWVRRCREKLIDPESGLLYQAVHYRSGDPIDEPRGSGTLLGLYALSFLDSDLSKDLYAAARENLARAPLGFGCVREYLPGTKGRGDIDSGPIVFGYGMSATGFMIAGSRIHGDPQYFRRLYATTRACGVPVIQDGRQNFISGGSLGDAILFAMLTARTPQ